MTQELSHRALKAKHRQVWGQDDPDSDTERRVRRALSWYKKAEQASDDDSRLIFLWIAFNAAYAQEIGEDTMVHERSVFERFFKNLLTVDSDKRIYDAIWQRFSGPIHGLMRNKFIYSQFWKYHNGNDEYKDWENVFHKRNRQLMRALKHKNNAQEILELVFDRLYVLRNQVIHGGSTCGGELNRAQIVDGGNILAFLVPVFIDLIMDNPFEDWGKINYPPIEE